VIVFAPHTSNWDFPLLLLARDALGLRASYLGKHTLFRPPFGWIFRALGGIPVHRGEAHHLVDQIAHEFQARDHLWLAMAPEGTRQRTDHWKSGFYRIALAAKVPVLLTFIDAERKQCGVGPLLELSGDVERDLSLIREFYADKRGIHPEQAGEIRFKSAEP
jgi:1-acyl-sn-glycerol-3-phosphate acyltransferase